MLRFPETVWVREKPPVAKPAVLRVLARDGLRQIAVVGEFDAPAYRPRSFGDGPELACEPILRYDRIGVR